MRALNDLIRMKASVRIVLVSLIFNSLLYITPAAQAAESQTSNSLKCSEALNTSPWKQIPECREFTPLKSTVGKDPLPYRENSDNSLIAIEGKKFPFDAKFEVLTPNQCANPRLLVSANFIDRGINYLLFQTLKSGMCQIRMTSISEPAVVLFELPVESWPTSIVFPPSIEFKKLPNLETIQIGETIQLSDLKFSYSGSRYDLGRLVPVELRLETPLVCSVDALLKLKAIAPGACEVSLQTPAFAFGSRIYKSIDRRISVFQSKSLEQVQAEVKAKKENQAAIAKKRAEDNKLCSPSNQSKLRSSYRALLDSNKRFSDLYLKHQKMSYLLRNGNKDQEIMLPLSEFPELLGSFPVRANTRNVPLFIYVAILEGAMSGERKINEQAQRIANSAYQKASPGCKKVVGKP